MGLWIRMLGGSSPPPGALSPASLLPSSPEPAPSMGNRVEELPVAEVVARPVRPAGLVRRVRGLVVGPGRGVLDKLLAVDDVVEVGLLGAFCLPLLVQPLDILKVLYEAVLDGPHHLDEASVD